ncbi:MAG: beta-1,4-galactosyltransferase [Candidatus Aenigmarchaeota archaeon]|nr:beta-1,4-galactosyltransferase [Candidatus Aenigmarchaeota archaeon]
MIFLTVGTHSQQFNRLLRKIDELIENKAIKAKVVAQIGNSDYRPKNYTWYKFVGERKMQNLYKNSRLVIMHAGVGSIITSLGYKKPTIVVPRLEKFGEHINDHQLQIAKVFEHQHKVLACYDINDLSIAIKKGFKFKPKTSKKQPKMIKIIQRFLLDLQ